MIYKPYGQTGKQCSILGFGGMRFKSIDDQDACVEMMIEAAKGGVNYFDTAPGYFGVKSETVFGAGFKELQKLNLPFYCATKTSASTETAIRKEIEAQLKRLGLDSIDFYHVWCIIDLKTWEQRKKNGVVTAFRKLKQEGLIKHICVSSHLIGDQIKELLKEEVFDEGLTRNIPAFLRFFEAMGYSHGELTNYANIARECGVDAKTVKEYYQILVDTLLGTMIEPFKRRQERQVITKAGKFYLAK